MTRDRTGGRRWLPRGPGMLVTAAFIGPGTVTTCSLAGARFGAALLWAMLLATLATIALQEMCVRLAIVSGEDLAGALRRIARRGGIRRLLVPLVLVAIVFGCAAYQVGNLLGAGLGIAAAVGGNYRWWTALSAAVGAALLWSGGFAAATRILTGLVGLMGICFLATAAAAAPSAGGIVRGLFAPSVPDGSVGLLLGLIGTTVVPYNLFLHSAAARQRWRGGAAMGEARLDLAVAIAIGGAISAAILLTAAGAWGGDPAALPRDARGLAVQLEPLLGPGARVLFGIGLFAAGLSSAVTAPLAAATTLSGILGLQSRPGDPAFRAVSGMVLAAGLLFALLDYEPFAAIVVAQAANGLLLPVATLFLLVAMNDREILGEWVNGRAANLAAGAVGLLALLFGILGWVRAVRAV